MEDRKLHLTALDINGQTYNLELELRVSFLDVLQRHLNLTGPKKGCDHGQRGACTIFVDSKRNLSCLTLGVMKDGRESTTIEGLADVEKLHPVWKAFIEHDAFQCGYCMTGHLQRRFGKKNISFRKKCQNFYCIFNSIIRRISF